MLLKVKQKYSKFVQKQFSEKKENREEKKVKRVAGYDDVLDEIFESSLQRGSSSKAS